MIPMDFEIDEDSISEESQDPEGLDLQKDNIEVRNFINNDYRNLMQEAYATHWALQEEKGNVLLILTKFKYTPFRSL